MTYQESDRLKQTLTNAEASAMRSLGHSMPARSGMTRNDMMSAFTDAVRENPVSAALIGMGALWLFMGGGSTSLLGGRNRSSVLSAAAHGAGSVAHGAGGIAHGAAHSMSRMGGAIASNASSKVGGFGESVSDAASHIGEYVSSIHGVDAQSGYRSPAFSDDEDMGGLRSSMRGMRGDLGDMFERHPMALGVAGLAIGAAVAASLPLTSQERETLGKATEAMRSKLGEATEQAKEMAAAMVDEVQQQGIGGASGHGPG